MIFFKIIFIKLFCDNVWVIVVNAKPDASLNLPANHLPCYYHNFPPLVAFKHCIEKDATTTTCKYTADGNFFGDDPCCWGYEDNCHPDNIFAWPLCPGDSLQSESISKQEQLDTFFRQADFGSFWLHIKNGY